MKQVLAVLILTVLSACAQAPRIHAKSKSSMMLQNPDTGKVVACRTYVTTPTNLLESANECALRFESKGWRHIRQEYRRAASYDVAVGIGYPPRRWREGENVPRW